MGDFRNSSPKRTCIVKYNDYTRYKTFLRNDFNKKCGYSDCSDFWFGGVRTFHIDHFKPKSKFPQLKSEYGNLVYCCSYINIQKSNDIGHYIDPCNTDYNQHFERDNIGTILPKKGSIEANYMYKKLKLYLQRYQIIWMLEQLENKIQFLSDLIKQEQDEVVKQDFLKTYFELVDEFFSYKRFLSLEQ